MRKSYFIKGLYHGIPIALGYLSVSLGFGIMAAKAGLTALEAFLISLTNLTSAGQAAGVGIIAAAGSYLEMAVTQLVINLRYALMGVSLSQKLDKSFTLPHRFIAAHGITDEIFAMASSQPSVSPWYMYGITIIATLGWTAGTFIGAAAGRALPAALTDAMGIMLYGMFIAVFLPTAKKNRSVLAVVCLAALCSILCYYVFTSISSGFAIIISAIIASATGALLFPIDVENEEVEQA